VTHLFIPGNEMHLNAKINYYFMFKINHGTGSLIQIDMLTVLIYKERKPFQVIESEGL